MKKLFSIILFLTATFSMAQTVALKDTAFARCLNEHYSTLLDSQGELILTEAANMGAELECINYHIQDIEDLQYFTKTWRITLSKINVPDLHEIENLTQLTQLSLKESQLGEVPNFSKIPPLNYVVLDDHNLTELPLFNDSIRIISVQRGNLTTVNNLERYHQLEQLMLSSNNIEVIRGYENLTELKFLLLGANKIKHNLNLNNLDKLERLLIHDNDIPAITNFSDKPFLWNVNIASNNLTEFPTFQVEPTNIQIGGNKFTFEDLIVLKDWDGFPENFGYHEVMQKQGENDTLSLYESSSWSWELEFDQGVNSNYYTWLKNGDTIATSDEGIFNIDVITPGDAGNYQCIVQNHDVPGISFRSKKRTITVLPFNDHPEPIAFSPNGDGEHDILYIEKPGTVKIYSENGQLVRTLNAPGNWDGTSDSGESLDLGLYIILLEDGSRINATLVR